MTMLILLKAALLVLLCDYIAVSFCRIAERVSLVEVYRGKKIYANYKSTVFGPKLVYTVDTPYVFMPVNDWTYIRVFSLDEARKKIDRDIRDVFIVKFVSPLRKMKVI